MERRNSTLVLAGIGCAFLLLIAVLIPISLSAFDMARNTWTQRDQPQTQQVEDQLPQTGINQQVEAQAGSLTGLFQDVSPGVVSIAAQVSQGGQTGLAAGSGFILDENGYIITNHHVVEGAGNVLVTFFNGIQAPAEVIGSNPDADLAVIKVDGLIPEVHPLALADSSQVMVGDSVVAIGNPFSLSNTMTSGIVSAVGRVIPSGFTPFNIPSVIQTDAAINPGNSGGPLINMAGEVIGVNVQIETGGSGRGNVGIGFAIPSNLVSLVAPALVETGSYTWPWLGVSGFDVNPAIQQANELSTQQGAYLAEIVPEGPADQAGLQGPRGEVDVNGVPVPVGADIVIAADGQPVTSFDSLLNIIAFQQPGDTVNLTVLRDGQQVEVPVTLEARPAGEPQIP